VNQSFQARNHLFVQLAATDRRRLFHRCMSLRRTLVRAQP
jgi:hypothetical protein